MSGSASVSLFEAITDRMMEKWRPMCTHKKHKNTPLHVHAAHCIRVALKDALENWCRTFFIWTPFKNIIMHGSVFLFRPKYNSSFMPWIELFMPWKNFAVCVGFSNKLILLSCQLKGMAAKARHIAWQQPSVYLFGPQAVKALYAWIQH